MKNHERGESSGQFAVLVGLLAGLIAITSFLTGRLTFIDTFDPCTSQTHVAVPSSRNLLLNDDALLLNLVEVQNAAIPLVERNAVVAIYTFRRETPVYDRVEESKRYDELLKMDGLTNNPNVISIYFTCYKGGTYIWYPLIGDNWKPMIDNSKWTAIHKVVDSNPTKDNYTSLVTTVLYGIDHAIAGKPIAPPTTIPNPTALASPTP